MTRRDRVTGWSTGLGDRRVTGATVIVAVQVMATVYFVLDGVGDVIAPLKGGLTAEVVMECFVALALAAGVAFGFRHVKELRANLRRQTEALSVARGALAEHLLLRFQEWRLSPAEAEITLFALKGFQIAEIAKLRGSALGTVRSQLSQVYAKAGVSSQSMLLSLFFDELLQIEADESRKLD